MPRETDSALRGSLQLYLVVVLAAFSLTASAQRPGSPMPSLSGAVIEVRYADTFQGQSARFAVRACVDSAEPVAAANLVHSPRPSIRFMTLPGDAHSDIVVLVLARDGHEVSRFEGSHDVCGYARFVASMSQDPLDAHRTPDANGHSKAQ